MIAFLLAASLLTSFAAWNEGAVTVNKDTPYVHYDGSKWSDGMTRLNPDPALRYPDGR